MLAVPLSIITLIAVAWALKRSWRALRGSPGALELIAGPAAGGKLAGSIRLSRALRDGQSMRLTLRCLAVSFRREIDGGSNASTGVVWENDREVGAEEIQRRGNVLPVEFSIPPGAEPSVDRAGNSELGRTVVWVLEVSAQPGGFMRGTYVVPVAAAAEGAWEARPARAIGSDEEKIVQPPSSRLTTLTTDEGLVVQYPLRARFVLSTVLFLSTLPLYAAPMIATRWLPSLAPSISPGRWVAALFVLNILPLLVFVIGEPRRLIANRRELVLRCGWPILGLQRRFGMDEYDGIDPDPRFFSILRKNAPTLKRRFFVTPGLQSNAEGRWLASELRRAVGK